MSIEKEDLQAFVTKFGRDIKLPLTTDAEVIEAVRQLTADPLSFAVINELTDISTAFSDELLGLGIPLWFKYRDTVQPSDTTKID